MKNLKKVLALVLVVAMAFSFMSFGSAKFTDDADIKYDTAVGVMTGIGAIAGYPDGNFKPAGLVTRAEAAKMVAYAILGPTVAAALSTSTSTFSDVPASHWASPFIEYCVAQGILNGRGDGTFDPAGNVTGFELAKMMLCAVGYGQNDEYVGANWSINVAKDAMQKNLFKGNENGNFAKAATREEAALYIFNGIYNVPQVDYNELFGYYGKGTSVTSGYDGTTIAYEVYKMVDNYSGNNTIDPIKGLVIGGSVTGTSKTGTYIAPANFADGKVVSFSSSEKYEFEAQAADIGQLVAVYYNSVTDQVYYTETLSATIKSAFGVTTAYNYVTTFGTATFGPSAEMYYINDSYATATELSGTPAAIAAQVAESTAWVIGATAPMGSYVTYGDQVICFVDNPAKTFDRVTLVTSTKGTESITFADKGLLSNSATSDKVKEYDGIKAGDYVVLTQTGTIYSIGKTTTVDGKITKVNNFFGTIWNGVFAPTLTMDGKDYTANSATGTAGLSEVIPDPAVDSPDNVYTLYLAEDGTWLVCMLKSGTSANNVVYVTGKTWTATENYDNVTKVQAVNNAGEQVVYTSLTGLDTLGAALTGGFYKIGTTGTTIKTNTFEAVTTSTAGYGATFAPATGGTAITATTVRDANTNYYFASDVNFIFVSGTGANLKITKVTGIASVVNLVLNNTDLLYFNETTSPNKTVTTVIVSGAYAGAAAAKTIYIKSAFGFEAYGWASPTGQDADGYTYTAYVDGVSTTIKATNSLITNADNFMTYTVDGKGVYTFTGVNSTAGAVGVAGVYNDATVNVNGVYNGMIATTAGDSWKVAADAKILDFATSSQDPAIYTSVGAMESVTATKGFVISYVKNAQDEITIMYVTTAATAQINIGTQPTGGPAVAGAYTLNVVATSTYGLNLSYQWYSNTTNSTTGGTSLNGKTAATCALTGLTTGAYYYCVISGANGAIKATTTPVQVTIPA